MKEKIIYFISWHVINHIKKDVNLFPSNQYCQLNMDEKEGENKKMESKQRMMGIRVQWGTYWGEEGVGVEVEVQKRE